MGIIYNRLLTILNEESHGSTYYHIAFVMLQNFEELKHMSINQVAQMCAVSKSTVSKFIRFIGYEDYSDFRYAAISSNKTSHAKEDFSMNVLQYGDHFSMDAMIDTIQKDIRLTYERLDWDRIHRMVEDLYTYKTIGLFGLMFSETAAMDLQIKLCHCGKIVFTNINDIKQDQFIREAGEDTLIVVFSESGDFINNYQRQRFSEEFASKEPNFSETKAKIVLITGNPDMEDDPRVSYCILLHRTTELRTHRITYGVLTDIIACQYHEYVKQMEGNQ